MPNVDEHSQKSCKTRALIACACALLAFTFATYGCAQSDRLSQMETEKVGGASQTYSSEELENMSGKGYFSDIYPFDKLLDRYKMDAGGTEGPLCYEGGYEVGGSGEGVASIQPGLYYFMGSQDVLSHFSVYSYTQWGDEQGYKGKVSIEYIGSYFMMLDAGDAIFFDPGSPDLAFFLAPSDAMPTSWPLPSGCYRVGIDIPEGTYSISVEEKSLKASEESLEGSPGAYVMNDVSFSKDGNNVVDKVLVEGSETKDVSVVAGQFLELFSARASLLG